MTNTDENMFIMSPAACYVSIVLISVIVSFQTDAGGHNANANREGADGRTSEQTQTAAAVLPVYMTQDRLTLAVVTLLLGGWLAFAITYPVVSAQIVLGEMQGTLKQLYNSYFVIEMFISWSTYFSSACLIHLNY